MLQVNVKNIYDEEEWRNVLKSGVRADISIMNSYIKSTRNKCKEFKSQINSATSMQEIESIIIEYEDKKDD